MARVIDVAEDGVLFSDATQKRIKEFGSVGRCQRSKSQCIAHGECSKESYGVNEQSENERKRVSSPRGGSWWRWQGSPPLVSWMTIKLDGLTSKGLYRDSDVL